MHPARAVANLHEAFGRTVDRAVRDGACGRREDSEPDRRTCCGHAAIDLFERLTNLRAPTVVRVCGQPPLALLSRHPQGLQRSQLLWIAHGLRLLLRALALQFF